MPLLPTNQHRKPEKFNRELQEKSWLNKTPQDLTSQKDMECPQGSVTPELCCEGSAFQKQELDTTMGSTVLSLQRE